MTLGIPRAIGKRRQANENGPIGVVVYVSVLALNALDAMDERAKPAADTIRALPEQDPSVPPRMKAHVPNLIRKTLADLE